MTFKQIYLNLSWDPNSVPRNNNNEGYMILSRSQKLGPHYQMQFNVLPKTSVADKGVNERIKHRSIN